MDAKSYNTYLHFSEADFIADPFFQDWVLHPDSDKESFWKNFIYHHPDKEEHLTNAREFLQNLHFAEHLPSAERVERSLRKHLEQISSTPGGKVVALNRFRGFGKGIRVAALFGGVALLISLFLVVNKRLQKVKVETAYGQTQSVILPDQSQVVLNAHSALTYKKNQWKQKKIREVWLKGEAFFNVQHLNTDAQHIQPNERFIVHTDHMDIEVLGTSFDIRQRRSKTEIVLQTGKIKVTFKDSAKNVVLMKPGEMVTYYPQEAKIERTLIIPENFTSWKEGKLMLNNPTVNEIIAYLEDNYGKKIVLQQPEMGNRIIEGPILFDNKEDVLFILSLNLNAKVVDKDSILWIVPK